MSTEYEQPGFIVHGTYYPLVKVDDWLNQDFVLAYDLTHVPAQELLGRDGDEILLTQALVAIAIRQRKPELRHEDILEVVGNLKPSEVEEVGFQEEQAPGPLAAPEPSASSTSSSTTSDEPSELTPETSPTASSGPAGSDTGSPA